MRQRARQAFVVAAWLFVGSIVIQVFLAEMGLFTYVRAELPLVAALHPVGAILLFWWALNLARDSRELAAAPADAARSPSAAER